MTRRPLSGCPVVLTFDDGYLDFEPYALSLLDRYGFRATLFVVSDQVVAGNAWDQTRETVPPMNWPSLRRLAARGFEIGGHTATHPRLTSLTDAEVVDELIRCRAPAALRSR
jgi:peptidoglycan/xylan/chitin deacetylase (PgdA/CDA1 family)